MTQPSHTTHLIHVHDQPEYVPQLIQLFTAYVQELNEDLCFQNLEAELQNPLAKYTAVYMAMHGQQAVGCIALLPLSHTTCEMKRLYIQPTHRKHGIAKCLVAQLLLQARNQGYTTMVLDTLQRLQPAIQLYTQLGFSITHPYYHNPLPHVVYMSKPL